MADEIIGVCELARKDLAKGGRASKGVFVDSDSVQPMPVGDGSFDLEGSWKGVFVVNKMKNKGLMEVYKTFITHNLLRRSCGILFTSSQAQANRFRRAA